MPATDPSPRIAHVRVDFYLQFNKRQMIWSHLYSSLSFPARIIPPRFGLCLSLCPTPFYFGLAVTCHVLFLYTHSILTIRHLFLFLSDSSCPSFHLSDMTVYPAPLLKLMMHDVYNTYIATGCSLKSFGCVCACMCQVCVCICFACVCMLSVRVCPSPSLHLKGWLLCVLCVYIQGRLWCIRLLSNTAQ